MFEITQIVKTRLNDNYDGVIHMLRYISNDDPDEFGVIFLEQFFNDEDNTFKTSFFGLGDDHSKINKKDIEKDFDVKILIQKGGLKIMVGAEEDEDEEWCDLYDDEIGTPSGKRFSIDNVIITKPVAKKINYNFGLALSIMNNSPAIEELVGIRDQKENVKKLRKAYKGEKKNCKNRDKLFRESFAQTIDQSLGEE